MNFRDYVRSGSPTGNAPALTVWETGENWTYDMLFARADAVALRLWQSGVRPGDRVALVAKNGPWFFVLLLSCSRIGAALVPINVKLASPEVSFILDVAQPVVIFTDEAGAGVTTAAARSSADVTRVAMVDPMAGTANHDWPDVAAQDVLMQIYTSGTTGKPKGAMLTHQNLIAICNEGTLELGRFHAQDRVLVCLPLFHIAAVDWAVFALARGAHIVLQSEVKPPELVAALIQHRVTKMLLVPAVIRMAVTVLEDQGRTVDTLQTLCFGASPMPEKLIQRARAVFPQAQMIHVYGMTESTGMFTFLPPEEIASGRRLLSCGKPFRSGAIAIVDDNGALLAAGTVGHILYRGPQIMLGYWRNEPATLETVRDGWLHTGDLGYTDEEGYLFVKDRSKDLVKSGGENVYPAEVENVLLEHPAVADVAVIGLADEQWGEAVTAVVVLRDGATLSLPKLQVFARKRLAGFKVPRRLIIQPALPRNAAGKVLKHVLQRSAEIQEAGSFAALDTEGNLI